LRPLDLRVSITNGDLKAFNILVIHLSGWKFAGKLMLTRGWVQQVQIGCGFTWLIDSGLTEFRCVLIWWGFGGHQDICKHCQISQIWTFGGCRCFQVWDDLSWAWLDGFLSKSAPLQTKIWSLWVPQLPVFVHPVVNRLMWRCVNAYPHHRPEMGRGLG
jgi:hypothetical protein